jgi:scavenger receptor class B, member 1
MINANVVLQKLGVPLEGFVRVQLNLKVDRAPDIGVNNINKFPDVIFPVMWIEEVHILLLPILKGAPSPGTFARNVTL